MLLEKLGCIDMADTRRCALIGILSRLFGTSWDDLLDV
jgi:hypothetical protein